MTTAKDFLLELGCEELPAKNLKNFAELIGKNITDELNKVSLDFQSYKIFVTPRRIAVLITKLSSSSPDKNISKKGPAVSAPEKAKEGFAKSCNITLDQLAIEEGYLIYNYESKGQSAEAILPQLISDVLSKISGVKTMRWGNHSTPFLRPIHWIVMLYGKSVINTELFGIKTGRHTYGHRFLSPAKINIEEPSEYENVLEEEGFVLVDFEKRKAAILDQITQLASKHRYKVAIDNDLLDEVTGIVEWPTAIWCEFDKAFLALPKEVIMLSLSHHQKCFAIIDLQDHIVANFITVSNIKKSKEITAGNERVVRARLSDAAFFYEQDQKTDFQERFELLKHITFAQKLGSLADKVERIETRAKQLAELMHINPVRAENAASLCKNDLTTLMVGEFPELQGVIGEYYIKNARLAGDRDEIGLAVREHYLPRFSGDELPRHALSCVIALADRFDTLESIFSVHGAPTGDKDPFGLRRAALGIIKIIIEKEIKNLNFQALSLSKPVHSFILERLPSYYQEQGINAEILQAVLEIQKDDLLDIHHRVLAVQEFKKLPEAAHLSEANKRVKNILKKYPDSKGEINIKLFDHAAEKDLYKIISEFPAGLSDYTEILNKLAVLKNPIDEFFDKVMVDVEDEKIKLNRVVLLKKMRELFLKVADISAC
ncbi:MAG TPA: glycine--tRNA ligase subunit beta [Gammaproteobacteria bacterium]|nr:glycine--tRNA ligase subunit beta [Gammaproteobacteria bacterium]